MTSVERSHYPLPVAALVLCAIMIYAFGMEMRALRWGFLNHVMDDFAFAWTPFLENPGMEFPKLLSHTFLHANAAHIVGNLIFFALFAPAVERAVGHAAFAALYLVWGVAAAATQGFFEPFSGGMIGASGAISGAAGAYFVLFPLRPPPSAVMRPLGKFVSSIPAFFWIGLWFLGQIKSGYRALMPDLLAGENIAYWAHIGGFAAGALSVAPFVGFGRKKVSDSV